MSASRSTMPRSDGKDWYQLELTAETAAKLQWLSAAQSKEWAGVIAYLVNVEAARAGYEPPKDNKG